MKALRSIFKAQAMLKAIEQGELVDKDCAQGKALSVGQSSCGYLSISMEDTFEVLVEVFDGKRMQFVENLPTFDVISGTSSLRGLFCARHPPQRAKMKLILRSKEIR